MSGLSVLPNNQLNWVIPTPKKLKFHNKYRDIPKEFIVNYTNEINIDTKVISMRLKNSTSIEIEFNIKQSKIKQSCYPTSEILNKNFISNEQLTSMNLNEFEYLIITNENMLEAAKKLEEIHTDLNLNIVSIDFITSSI